MGTYACDACGRAYKWKPELAGKSVRCKCGQVFRAPTDDPAPPLEAGPPIEVGSQAAERTPLPSEQQAFDDALYDLAPDSVRGQSAGTPVAPPLSPPMPVEAELPPIAAPPPPVDPMEELLARKGIVHHRSKLKAELETAEHFDLAETHSPSTLRDVVAPILLIGIGLALMVVEAAKFSPKPAGDAMGVIIRVGTNAPLAAGLTLAGAWLAIRYAEVALVGEFKDAVLRLIGIGLAPSSFYAVMAYALGDLAGALVGALGACVLYFALFRALMRMNNRDAFVMAAMTWILIFFAHYAAFQIEGARSGSMI